MEFVDCPADGCDWGPAPPSSVAGHYGGTKDGDHSGGYQACMDLLRAQGSDPDDDPDDDPDGGPEEPERAPAGSETGSQVDPPAPPEPDVPACPECGETDWFDPSEHGYDGPRDRGCPSCSTAEDWVLYNV